MTQNENTGKARRLNLTEEQVLHIRIALAQKTPGSELAKQYGCSATLINRIGSYDAYAHFGGPKITRNVSGGREIVVTHNAAVTPKTKTAFGVVPKESEKKEITKKPLPLFNNPPVSTSKYLYRSCLRCGVRIFNSLADALSVMADATEANVSAAPLK